MQSIIWWAETRALYHLVLGPHGSSAACLHALRSQVYGTNTYVSEVLHGIARLLVMGMGKSGKQCQK